MADHADPVTRSIDPMGRALYALTRGLALIGGFLVCVMALLATVSIVGRSVLGYAVPGDYEMVGVLNGTIVFAFLPYCQLMGGNVVVDFFMLKAPERLKALCDALGSLLFFGIASLLTWRLYFGAVDMYRYGEVTSTLNFPRWLTFPFDIFCMAILILVTIYTTQRSFRQVIGRSPASQT